MAALIDRLKEHKLFSELFTEKSIAQLKKYLVTGFSTAALEISLLYLFKDVAHYSTVISNSIALTISFWFNFLLNRVWSFKSKEHLGKQLSIYALLFAFNLGASDLIMYLLTDVWGLMYLISKVFAIGAVVSWNFILYKKVIFKN